MQKAIIGKKVGMSQIFDENGHVIPVTVIEAGPCTVVQKKTSEKEGYNAVQLGFQVGGIQLAVTVFIVGARQIVHAGFQLLIHFGVYVFHVGASFLGVLWCGGRSCPARGCIGRCCLRVS